jgi:hypothetical protein
MMVPVGLRGKTCATGVRNADPFRWHDGFRVIARLSIVVLAAAPVTLQAGPPPPLETESGDFFGAGTQPDDGSGSFDGIVASDNCFFCHSEYDLDAEPYRVWASSMMGQSARDPMFWACLTVANQDAAGSGEFCIRCHMPNAWLNGHATPGDGSALTPLDFEGIACNFCHRLVSPKLPVAPGSPASDHDILKDLQAQGLLPPQGSNARWAVDPSDSRRGPRDDLIGNPHNPVPVLASEFHRSAEFCWSCHDVSNPLFVRQPDNTYLLDEPLGNAHPTGSQFDMFPLHRVYSEWKNSYYFTAGGVQHNGRFGGNHATGVMHVCQDCHMPDQDGKACGLPAYPIRPDVAQHSFIGANTWGLKAVRAVDFDGNGQPDFPDSVTHLSNQSVAAAIARNTEMLEKASDLALTQIGGSVRARITNFSGHKLPTGFPDGRRMWVNVKFYDRNGTLVEEHGEFDFDAGTILDPQDTKVYEVKLGLDAAQAARTGLPEGDTFHFMVANVITKDNRIPSTGFSNAVALQEQHEPVGATYSDGQNWDDTLYEIPGCADQVTVTVYFQLVSAEYITFLRDANYTDNRGQVAYDLWNDPAVGNRSAPVVMDMAAMDLAGEPADLDGNGSVGISDFLQLLSSWGPCPPAGDCPGDLDCDGEIGVTDFLHLLSRWTL